MPGQGRLGDKANVPLDAHGCPACPHPAIGPAICGSPDVNVNRRPALRVDDPGIHAACCGTNTWTATKGSLTVLINGKAAHRMGDQNRHCGGMGQLAEGSLNVIVGDSGGAGPGSGGTNGSGSHGSGGGSGGGGGAASSGRGGSSSNLGAAGRASSASRGGPTNIPVTGPPPVDADKTFLELELIDSDGKPVGLASYRVTASDGVVFSGTLDAKGRVRIERIARGSCKVTFPDLHADDWSAA